MYTARVTICAGVYGDEQRESVPPGAEVCLCEPPYTGAGNHPIGCWELNSARKSSNLFVISAASLLPPPLPLPVPVIPPSFSHFFFSSSSFYWLVKIFETLL